jgi:hypothetical protein
MAVHKRDDERLILTFSTEMGTVIHVTLSHLSLLLCTIIKGKKKRNSMITRIMLVHSWLELDYKDIPPCIK